MGYTHYWTFKKTNNKEIEALYQKTLLECVKIVKYYQKNCESHERLSGYTAHTKIGEYKGILFNGKQELAHETFLLKETLDLNEDFNFCKTAQKPYDLAVVACLCILKYRLKEYIEVSSDGDFTDWNDGLELARKVLRRKIKNPINNGSLELVA